ncbi:hypothetical protein PG1604B_0092 [Bifidobacterium pseudolongum subsp. pseudolongum]|nr:hypothetical protein PG1604B_0092 [Bifidobacterium pseudolongum subsp. pseudolongum]
MVHAFAPDRLDRLPNRLPDARRPSSPSSERGPARVLIRLHSGDSDTHRPISKAYATHTDREHSQAADPTEAIHGRASTVRQQLLPRGARLRPLRRLPRKRPPRSVPQNRGSRHARARSAHGRHVPHARPRAGSGRIPARKRIAGGLAAHTRVSRRRLHRATIPRRSQAAMRHIRLPAAGTPRAAAHQT